MREPRARKFTILDKTNEVLVGRDRRGTCGQSEYERPLRRWPEIIDPAQIPKLSTLSGHHHGSLRGSKLVFLNTRRNRKVRFVLSNAPFCDVLSDVLPNTRRIIANNKTWWSVHQGGL